MEIERKFLLSGNGYIEDAMRVKTITQAYLITDPNKTVRIRKYGNDMYYLTIKGISSDDGTSREEIEKEISKDEYKSLLSMCDEANIIRKIRYVVPVRLGECETFFWEVDEFKGKLEGLRLAEIELYKPDELFPKPDWVGEEVTGDVQYYNSNLLKRG